MKRPWKFFLIALSSAAAVGAAAIYVGRPENYIKIHYPKAEILSVEHRPGGFMFSPNYIRYKLYDPVNEFTFYQDFSDSTFPKAYKNAYGYDEFMVKKRTYDSFISEIPELYGGEFFTRYDLNATGLYIFVREPEYEELGDLIAGLNALENRTEYVLYSLPEDIYEEMREQDFKRLSSMAAKEPYHSYCFKLVELFLGYGCTYLRVSDEAALEVFERSDTMIVRSGYEGTKGAEGLIHSKNFGKDR